MKAQIIDGKQLAQNILDEIASEVTKQNIKPGLATVLVGNDAASNMYVDIKGKRAKEVGFRFTKKTFPGGFKPTLVVEEIQKLNSNNSIHGIIVQLPLPDQFERHLILKQIHPFKDVDGLHPKNLGLLVEGHPVFLNPFTLGVLEIIKSTKQYPLKALNTHFGDIEIPDVTGARIALMGNGILVGRPLSILFAQLRATVSVLNSVTPQPESILKEADIIVTGTRDTNVLNPNDVKDGAIVISGGEDIDDEKFLDKEIFLSKNRGGIGPLTVAFLLKNTLDASLAAK